MKYKLIKHESGLFTIVDEYDQPFDEKISIAPKAIFGRMLDWNGVVDTLKMFGISQDDVEDFDKYHDEYIKSVINDNDVTAAVAIAERAFNGYGLTSPTFKDEFDAFCDKFSKYAKNYAETLEEEEKKEREESYVPTPEEKECILNSLHMNADELDYYILKKKSDDCIIVTTPRHNWMTLSGREWEVSLSTGTANCIRMS